MEICVQIIYIYIYIYIYMHAYALNTGFKIFLFYILVPTPVVSITPPVTQIVGDPLTLQCEVTTVRGITSRVDIVWSRGGMELEKMNGVSSTTMDNSLVYTHSYTIPHLSTTDEGRMIQCEVMINTSPSVMANGSITLDVTGEYCMTLYLAVICYCSTHGSHSYRHHITIWSHTRSDGG